MVRTFVVVRLNRVLHVMYWCGQRDKRQRSKKLGAGSTNNNNKVCVMSNANEQTQGSSQSTAPRRAKSSRAGLGIGKDVRSTIVWLRESSIRFDSRAPESLKRNIVSSKRERKRDGKDEAKVEASDCNGNIMNQNVVVSSPNGYLVHRCALAHSGLVNVEELREKWHRSLQPLCDFLHRVAQTRRKRTKMWKRKHKPWRSS